MKITETGFSDLFVVSPDIFNDKRGGFVKTIHDKFYNDNGLTFIFKESFYSTSNKNVIRGMHFQNPPKEHEKLVYVIKGSILDVVLDVRISSPTYGKHFSIKLNDTMCNILYIGKGFAHGFLSLEDQTIVEYHTSTSQSPEHECGIVWNSFGFNWPVNNPVLSERDQKFQKFIDYKSIFQ